MRNFSGTPCLRKDLLKLTIKGTKSTWVADRRRVPWGVRIRGFTDRYRASGGEQLHQTPCYNNRENYRDVG